MTLAATLCPPDWELVETHISWVLLAPADVFKIKKPVDFGFLDFTTLERRREACEAEVRLNRRLAPEVYLGVVPIRAGRDGVPTLAASDDGPVVEWAVHMRRMPDRWRADVRLAAGTLDHAALEAIAGKLAKFHAAAPCHDVEDHLAEVRTNVVENFEQTRSALAQGVADHEAKALRAHQLGTLASEAERFSARTRDGKVRDGHGDLRLEHIYLDDAGKVIVLDCIEFNERFRRGDTASDVAFVAMDLEFHGRVDLAERFLAAYARASNDFDLYGVVDFYVGYRAHVRGKIASFVADSAGDQGAREHALRTAHKYFKLAVASGRPSAMAPVIVAVGGPIASGKTTVAAALSRRLSAPVVDTDHTRKFLAGVEASSSLHDGAFSDAYAPNRTVAVYEEVFRRAEVVLRSGRPVILEASFRTEEFRRRALQLAGAGPTPIPFHFVECVAPESVIRERLGRRDLDGSVSDGRLEVLDEFLRRWEPVTELDSSQHHRIDTTVPVEENMAILDAVVPTWPRGLTG